MDSEKLLLSRYANPETREASKEFIRRHIIDSGQLEECTRLSKRVFSAGIYWPEMVFQEQFVLRATIGGVLYSASEYERQQALMRRIGEKYFYIIEVSREINLREKSNPLLRFRFEATAKWVDLMSGGGLSMELFQSTYRDFYIFGDSGLWGRLAANDWDTPISIFGYAQQSLSLTDREISELSLNGNHSEVIPLLPSAYRSRINQ